MSITQDIPTPRSLPRQSSLLSELGARMHGPGGYYNVGNLLGLVTALGLQFASAAGSARAGSDIVVGYFVGLSGVVEQQVGGAAGCSLAGVNTNDKLPTVEPVFCQACSIPRGTHAPGPTSTTSPPALNLNVPFRARISSSLVWWM